MEKESSKNTYVLQEDENLGSVQIADEVVAMIASAGISILVTAFWGNSAVIDLTKTNWSLVIIFLVSLVFLQKLKWNPVLVMVLAGVMKLAVAVIQGQG